MALLRSSQPADGAVALHVSKWTLFSYIGPLVLAGAMGGYLASGPLWALSAATALLLVLVGGILLSTPYRAAVLHNSPVLVIGPSGIEDLRRGLAIRWDQVASIDYRESAYVYYTRRFLGVFPVEGATLPERRLTLSERRTTRKAPELQTYLTDVQVGLGGIRVSRDELGHIIRRYFDGDLYGFDIDSAKLFTPEQIDDLKRLPNHGESSG